MSSLGKKFTIAVTGAGLYFFVIIHLIGNLGIFGGREVMNAYAAKLMSMPILLWTARIGLLAFFLVHIYTGVRLGLENRAARPKGYVKKNTVQATIASRTMVQTGLLILAFVIYHLLHFTVMAVHPEYKNLHDSLGRHDVYTMVVTSFSDWRVSAAYIVAMFFLALHLRQAFSGIFQTFGLSDERRLKMLSTLSLVFSIAIFLGYASIPAAVLLGVVG